MKAFLFSMLTILLIGTSCKKKDQIISSYPTTFAYQSAGNVSAIRQFIQTLEISAPNHPTSKEPIMVNLPALIPVVADSLFGDIRITFESATKLRYQDARVDTTFPYLKVGNYVLIGPYLYEFTSDQIVLHGYYMVNQRYNGGSPSVTTRYDVLGNSELKSVVMKQLTTNDTASARSYDVYFKKQ